MKVKQVEVKSLDQDEIDAEREKVIQSGGNE